MRRHRRLLATALLVAIAGTLTTAAPAQAAGSTSYVTHFPVQEGSGYRYVDTWGAPRSGGRQHQGVDILAPEGTPVLAAQDGTVAKIVIAGGRGTSLSGTAIRIRSDEGNTFYAHLSAIAEGIDIGTAVTAGTPIGYVGHTGNAGINHLHFEVHPGNGASVSPAPVVKAVDPRFPAPAPTAEPAVDTAPVAPVDPTVSVVDTAVAAPVDTTAPPAPPTTIPAAPAPVTTVAAPAPAPTVPATTTTIPAAPTTTLSPAIPAAEFLGKSGVIGAFYNGPKVRAIQAALNAAGMRYGKIDGFYGLRTVQYVAKFQKANGLTEDGLVTKATFEKLRPDLRMGS